MSLRIACDIHTHTLYSRHAYSTIAENVAAARAAGLELLGSTDHLSSMLFDTPTIKDFQFFKNQVIWPREWDGVYVLRGAEVDIVSVAGALYGQDIPCPYTIVGTRYRVEQSMFECVTENLDYLIASVHNPHIADGANLVQTTAMYVTALENPRVLVLGHTGRSGVPFDLDEVLTAAKELGKCIEINNHSLERGDVDEQCARIAQRCAELGVGITVSSDAHICTAIGDLTYAHTMLEAIDFPQELIMNRDRDTMLSTLKKTKVCSE